MITIEYRRDAQARRFFVMENDAFRSRWFTSGDALGAARALGATDAEITFVGCVDPREAR